MFDCAESHNETFLKEIAYAKAMNNLLLVKANILFPFQIKNPLETERIFVSDNNFF
jgi:hypothetical protein